MRLALLLSVLALAIVGCSGERQPEQVEQREAYGPEAVADRRAVLERLLVEAEKDDDSEDTRELRRLLAEHERSTAELEEALPALTRDEDYYRLRCEYLDAMIQLLQGVELPPEDRP